MITIPFHGSKKTSYKFVKPIVQKHMYKAVYEPFGGSGVLSVNLLNEGVVEKAAINDYDRFFEDYEEYLDYKEWVVKSCYEHGFINTHSNAMHGTYYKDKDGEIVEIETALLSDEHRKYLQSLMEQVPKKHWKKMALGSNFTFPGVAQHEEVKISDFRYFHSYVGVDRQRRYLEVIRQMEVDSCDYREFLEKRKAEIGCDSLLLIDPPYAGTGQGAYEGEFTEEDTFELIELLKELQVDFVFFNKNKEAVEKYLDGLDIIESGFVGTGAKADKVNRNRVEHYALVSFNAR